MNNQKVPKIRFKGFSGDWEQRKLGDISTSYSGGTPTAGKDEYYGGIIPFIRSGEISSDHTELFLTERGFNSSSAVMVKQGDILYALYGATSGEVSISKLNGAINQAILAVLPNDGYDTDFIMQWLRKSKDSIVSTYLQGGQGNLSATIVNQLHIDLPSYNEQRRIGAFFKVLDNNITLHQSKLDKLKIIKKSMLENCFPKNGENVPKFRFSGFTGDWEQRKLSELVEKYEDPVETPHDGYTRLGIRSHAKGTFHEYVKPGHELETAQMHRVAANRLIFNITFAWEHAVAITDENDAGKLVSHRFPQFTLSDALRPEFLKYVILDEDFHHNLYLSSPGGAGRNRVLKTDEALDYPIYYPSADEQHTIGTFLDKLTDLITLHQSKLDKLKVIKKTLLESMFV